MQHAKELHVRLVQGSAPAPRITLTRLLTLYLAHRTPRKCATEQQQNGRRAELWTRFLGPDKDPHLVSLAEWERFLDARGSGAVDAHGRNIPAESRRPVRARTVEADARWLRWVLNWGTRWRDDSGRYLLRENAVHGYEVEGELNPRRPVATQDRHEALRAVGDHVTMELRHTGTARRVRSYLSELLDFANGTGRRLVHNLASSGTRTCG